MFACPIQSWTRSTPKPLLNKCVAQQCFNTWKCRSFAGMPTAAPYFFIKRCSVVRSIGRFCLDRKIGPGKGSAHLEPGAERPSFLAHQVLAGVRAFQSVNEDPVGLGIVVAELEHSDFGRALRDHDITRLEIAVN